MQQMVLQNLSIYILAAQIKEIIKKVSTISKNITVNEIKSKYKHFPARKRYSEFTGIDSKFFANLK